MNKDSCTKEFMEIYQKSLNNRTKIIPIVLNDFNDLSKLPKNLSDIKALSLINNDSEDELSKQVDILANDLIKQRND